jgi:hypothetical protein
LRTAFASRSGSHTMSIDAGARTSMVSASTRSASTFGPSASRRAVSSP